MKEKDLQSMLSKYLRTETKNFKFSLAYELKIKKYPKPLNLTHDLQPQQLPSLIKANQGSLHRKISDADFLSLKPFDGFQLHQVPAFLVCCWYTPRQPKILYWMDPIRIHEAMLRGLKSIKPHEAINYTIYLSVLP